MRVLFVSNYPHLPATQHARRCAHGLDGQAQVMGGGLQTAVDIRQVGIVRAANKTP